mmetsp:Transcript_2326/g.3475  ORF Transcript_2326/g.3475 Transcript_2326/m.3475 type:complete len:86 (+) Transcript_2326:58-315(+)
MLSMPPAMKEVSSSQTYERPTSLWAIYVRGGHNQTLRKQPFVDRSSSDIQQGLFVSPSPLNGIATFALSVFVWCTFTYFGASIVM